jgi:hypothetical protein
MAGDTVQTRTTQEQDQRPGSEGRRAEQWHLRLPARTVLVGILADPGLPTEIANQLADDLPDALAERSGDRLRCRVVVVSATLSRGEGERLIDMAAHRKEQEGWDFAVALTDLPLPTAEGQLVADLSKQADAAVIAVPMLSMLRPTEHARDIIVRLLLEWAGEATSRAQHRLDDDRTPAVRSVSPDYDDIDLRLAADTRTLRLLAGMVWVNRPWRLVLGLRSAIAAALATAAFGLVSNGVWQVSGAMSTARLWVATVVSLAVIVIWLIANHRLWQHPAGPSPGERSRVRLYNAATVLTLVIGCTVAYAVLLVGTLLTAAFVVVPEVLATAIGRPAGFVDHLRLAWIVSSLATIGGALGAGLESEEAVRTATYGNRVRHLPVDDEQRDGGEDRG